MRSLNSTSKRSYGGWYMNMFKFVTATMAVLLLCLPTHSQSSNGRILGTVTDASGGVVAGATVTVVDVNRGITRALTTDEAGEYNAPNLTPGTYTVQVEAKGFKKLDRQNLVIEVGKEVRVDLTVLPGEQDQTVTVTEAAPLVETTNATLGGTINNAEINDMPLNGRNYQNLLSLRPGVTVQPGGGPWTQSSNNVRPDESVWMLEGVINVEWYDTRPMANTPSFITDGATILPVDAIQEFNTMENPKAEYGWKPGAVVNVGLKSGTNDFHGSAYGFYRSAAWDARNLFNPDVNASPVACAPATQGGNPADCAKFPTQLKQFGGVVGGPIKKDKLFFFAGYEGLRDLIGQAIVSSGTPETGISANGTTTTNMSAALQALQTADVAVSPVSLGIAGCPALPALGSAAWASYTCTGGLWPANLTNSKAYTSFFPNTNISDNGVAKIDYHLNDKNTINGSILADNYTGNGMDHPFVNKIFLDTNKIRTYTITSDWVYAASSRWVNDARFGWDRIDYNFITDDSQFKPNGTAPFYLNTGVTQFGGFPTVNLKGFEKLGTWHNRPQHFGNDNYDFQDAVSYLLGKHSFKFGVEFAHIDITNAIYDTGRGLIKFNGGKTADIAGSTPLEDFFAGNPSSGQLLAGNANREETFGSYAGFAQDDWRVTPKVTVNLGLRYSYVSPYHEVNGLWGNFDPTVGLVQQPLNGTIWNPDYKDFSPRAGFAWDLNGKGTTVVRGGFSIMYSAFSAVALQNENSFQNSTSVTIAAVPTGALLEVGGCVNTNTCQTAGGTIALSSAALGAGQLNWDPAIHGSALNGGLVFPGASSPIACGDGLNGDAGPWNILAVNPNLKTPYVTNWNLGIQHQLTTNLSLEVEYVGTHGSRLTGFRDINQTNNLGVAAYATKFPYLGYINQESTDAYSNYHSLQMTLTKRFSRGLSFVAGYTYGHGLDNNSLNRSAYIPQDSFDPNAEYGSSDFDIRHRFTITTTYACLL